jgi:hypothetical protein
MQELARFPLLILLGVHDLTLLGHRYVELVQGEELAYNRGNIQKKKEERL